MAKAARSEKPPFRCAECGWTTVKWVGRCGECQAWGTVEDVSAPKLRTIAAGPVSAPALPITDVDVSAAAARSTNISELDRVLGGGIVPGAVILLAGEPGVGKSTLLLDVAAKWGERALYVSGEESAAQIKLRANRVGAISNELFLAAESDLSAVLGHIQAVTPTLVIADSVQTIGASDVDGAIGGVTQVREVAAALIREAKTSDVAVIIVGHVTKDGSVAGPRTLEHLVDVVLHFEGDRHNSLRMVRAVKNRYGAADEVGCFELTDSGIIGLVDPSGLFLSDRNASAPGTAVTVTIEGRRPLVAQVQSLVNPSNAPSPRRVTSGLDAARVAMILAVLERHGGVKLAAQECFVATVGGVKLVEPATDLAALLAIASGVVDRALPGTWCAFGEVGLSGEVRKVSGLDRRLAEAERLGFTDVIIPTGNEGAKSAMRLHPVGTIREALALLSSAK